MNKKTKFKKLQCRYTEEEIPVVKKVISNSKFKTYTDLVRFYTLSNLDNVFVDVQNGNKEQIVEVRNLVVAINRLNNNLNQIAKQVNTHVDKIDKIKFEILAAIKKIREDSNELRKEYLK